MRPPPRGEAPRLAGGPDAMAPPGPVARELASVALRPPRLRREAAALSAAGGTGWPLRLVRDVPSLVGLVVELGLDPRVSRLDKLLLAGAFAYVAVPRDLIAEWIPSLGHIDDLLVLGFTVRRLLDRAGADLLLEHWQGDPLTLELLLDTLERFHRAPAGVPARPGRRWARGSPRARR